MNILNENEAIVINSLENWNKVAEILDEHNVRWREGRASGWTPRNKPDFRIILEHGFLAYEVECLGYTKGKTLIQDTEFIAKHSLDKLKSEFDNRTIEEKLKDLNQDKNMKIRVLKENGLLEVGKECKLTLSKDGEYYFTLTLNRYFAWQVGEWLANGYIEEVKEVSYRFEEVEKSIDSEIFDSQEIYIPATEKQYEQMQAFAKLTHVRAKILKDAGHSEDWEPDPYQGYCIIIRRKDSIVMANYSDASVYGVELSFPTRELAELALKDNQELFKTYLGV